MQFEEFKVCLEWWNNREENDHAWRVHANDILANGCNLDIKNPNNKQDIEHMPPEQIVEDILAKEQRIMEIMREMKKILERAKE